MRFSSRAFFDFSSDFFMLLFFFLSDLFCSHSELKLVNIKLVAAKTEGTNSTVGSAYGYEREVNGSNHDGVKCFSSACRSSAIFPRLVVLCFRNGFPIRS